MLSKSPFVVINYLFAFFGFRFLANMPPPFFKNFCTCYALDFTCRKVVPSPTSRALEGPVSPPFPVPLPPCTGVQNEISRIMGHGVKEGFSLFSPSVMGIFCDLANSTLIFLICCGASNCLSITFVIKSFITDVLL